jgi:hypothetical protein
MELENFRELLLKKSADSSLDNLIRFVHDDLLAHVVIESLEKMAVAKHKGDKANVAVRQFATHMDPHSEPVMMHDALSHHASRYKAALRDGRQDLANQHMRQIYKTMDMGTKTEKHTQGKLHLSFVEPKPWERHAKSKQYDADHPLVSAGKRKAGDFVTDTTGFSKMHGPKQDYKFLQNAPHESYGDETSKSGNTGAYPLEKIRVNGKYLHIDDVPKEELHGFEAHPFDKHPIMDHFHGSAHKRTPEQDADFLKKQREWPTSDHSNAFWDKHEKLEAADPEAYGKRGAAVASPVHGEPDEQPAPTPTPATATSATTPATTPKEEKKSGRPSQEQIDQKDEHFNTLMNSDLPDSVKQSIRATLGKK